MTTGQVLVARFASRFAARLGFVALALISMIATFGLVLVVSHQAEQQVATRLAQAEMANIQAKLKGLTDQQKIIELSTIAASRHLASQIARGADIANKDVAKAPNSIHCTTPELDRRIIAASFSPDQLPGEPETQFAGTPLNWRQIDLDKMASQQIVLPIGSACNSQAAFAQIVVSQFGKATIVTGWMTQPLQQKMLRHWKPAGLAFGVLLIVGLCLALIVESRAQAQMRRLTFVLNQVGAGHFDARPPVGAHKGEYQHLSDAISTMAQQLGAMHAGLTSLMDRTAHDLRTPLARAIARINLVILSQSDNSQANQLKDVEADLRDLSNRFGAMMALREAASLNLGTLEPVDLSEIAQLAALLYQDLDIGEGKILKLDLGPAWISAQRGLVQNAVANLLDNALRFTPVGGHITISTRLQDSKAILSIADSGPGLGPNEATRLFEAGVTTRAHEGGHGLGLATVREVAQRFNGSITLENALAGRGAVATLSFSPIAPPF